MIYNVIGAGITGITFARVKAEEGHRVRIWESSRHIGGNLRDELDPTGSFFVHLYGPHLFHTNSDKVMQFLEQFSTWVPYQHRVVGTSRDLDRCSRTVFPVPYGPLSAATTLNRTMTEVDAAFQLMRETFNRDRVTLRELDTLKSDLPILNEIKEFVTETVFGTYSKKMWNVSSLDDLPDGILNRVPIALNGDDRYFTDRYQCLPLDGYSNMIDRMVAHPNITIHRECAVNDSVSSAWEDNSRVFCTAPIDEFFENRFGRLPYRGILFSRSTHTGPVSSSTKFNGAATMNFLDSRPTTRVTSMRSINDQSRVRFGEMAEQDSPDIHITETPIEGVPGSYHYPIPSQENRDLWAQYENLLTRRPNLRFGGRLGSYQYMNIDQAVAQAMSIARQF
jgi:UDP-galactopyranose mutase